MGLPLSYIQCLTFLWSQLCAERRQLRLHERTPSPGYPGPDSVRVMHGLHQSGGMFEYMIASVLGQPGALFAPSSPIS